MPHCDMMNTLAIFCVVCLLSTATPGPSVLYVTSQGVSSALRTALASSLGILTADAFYILLSITGLTAVLIASYELFLVIKWIGAVYLVYFGLRLIRIGLTSPDTAGVTAAAKNPGPARNAFFGGFVVHASNPKALLYFGSLVPQFVDQSHPLVGQLLALTVVHLVSASSVLAVYSVLAARFRGSATNARVRRVFHVTTGSFLVGAGVSLALARKSAL